MSVHSSKTVVLPIGMAAAVVADPAAVVAGQGLAGQDPLAVAHCHHHDHLHP